MNKPISILKNIDKTTVILFLMMISLGWMNIFSAEISENHQSIFDISQNYGKQLLFIFSAIIIALVVLIFDAKFFPAFAWLIYGTLLVILVGVLLFGTEINASRSWFRIGEFAIQPSEFSKFATALALAKYLGKIKSRPNTYKVTAIAAGIIMLPAFLILMQNDTGTSIVFASLILVLFREGYISATLMVAGATALFLFVLTLLVNEFLIIGILALITFILSFRLRNKKHEQWQLIGLFAVLAIYVYFIDFTYDKVLQPHQKTRIEVLVNENTDLLGAGYNLHQSKIAIGSGGFWGKGYLKGTQTKYNFVPEQGTDFIFCTIGEEWGFVGSTIIVGLFVLLLYRLIVLAERQKSAFSRIYGYALTSFLFIHFAINIGMTMGLVPIIGIPLPFFSYGGSSLWGFTIMLFIFLKLDSKRLDLI